MISKGSSLPGQGDCFPLPGMIKQPTRLLQTFFWRAKRHHFSIYLKHGAQIVVGVRQQTRAYPGRLKYSHIVPAHLTRNVSMNIQRNGGFTLRTVKCPPKERGPQQRSKQRVDLPHRPRFPRARAPHDWQGFQSFGTNATGSKEP
jgi:hypothetical protein